MQVQKNEIKLCPKSNEFESLCPIELMLISQIIPFMFIVAKNERCTTWSERAMCFSTSRFEERSDHFTKIVR